MARLTKAQIEAKLRKHFPGVQAKLLAEVVDALATDVATAETNISTIGTWGAALATKLNADAGVTDTNYDTTPLA